MNNTPWYTNCEPQIDGANLLIKKGIGLVRGADKTKASAEKENYLVETAIRLIFESNRIEDAGLSEGDTRKLILDTKLPAPSDRMTFADAMKEVRVFHHQKVKRYSRSEEEVIFHFIALFASAMSLVNPFKEENILKIHSVMMAGLIPEEWGLESGHYRNAPAHTDHQTLFTDWRNIPAAMKDWIKRSNRLMRSKEPPILKAARISYDFVAIHPFPDGNGRLSRLILNMALRGDGLPFYAVLRGNKKEKHRYLFALRRANRGDLGPYQCLIARAVNQGFDELREKLRVAGIDVGQV